MFIFDLNNAGVQIISGIVSMQDLQPKWCKQPKTPNTRAPESCSCSSSSRRAWVTRHSPLAPLLVKRGMSGLNVYPAST